MGNPFERKFKEFASTLSAKNAHDHADATAVKSGEVFQDKPFSQEFRTLYRVATIGQSVSQIVTFCTTAALGVFALTHIIPLWWGIYLAVPLGIAFAFGVENVKRSTLAIASKHLLKYKTFGFVGIVAALTLCVSIAAALYGAKELPGIVYPTPQRTTDPAAVSALTADIGRVQTDIDRLQSGLKLGKNWVAENKTLPRLQKERAALVDRRDAATAAAEGRADAQHNEAQQDRAAKVEKMQTYSVGAAIVAELVFLLCTVFVLYYLFRHYAEQQAATEPTTPTTPNQTVTVSPNGKAVASNLRAEGEGVRYTIPAAPARDNAMSNGALSSTHSVEVVDSGLKPCAWCEKMYRPKTTWQKFCSTDCKFAENEHRHGTRFDPGKAKFKKKATT